MFLSCKELVAYWHLEWKVTSHALSVSVLIELLMLLFYQNLRVYAGFFKHGFTCWKSFIDPIPTLLNDRVLRVVWKHRCDVVCRISGSGPPEPEIPLKADMVLALSRVAENRWWVGGVWGVTRGVDDVQVCFGVKLTLNCDHCQWMDFKNSSFEVM